MAEVKLITKIQTFEDVQKSLQEIEKVLNSLTEAVNSKADKEAKDPEGKPGDLKMTKNFNGSNDLEGKTEDGWVKLATKDKFDTGWFTTSEDAVNYFRHNIEINPGDILRCDLYIKNTSNGMIVHLNAGMHPVGHYDATSPYDDNDNISTSFNNTHLFFSIDLDNTRSGIIFPPDGVVTDSDTFGTVGDGSGWYSKGGASMGGAGVTGNSVVIYDNAEFRIIATKEIV